MGFKDPCEAGISDEERARRLNIILSDEAGQSKGLVWGRLDSNPPMLRFDNVKKYTNPKNR